MKPLIVTYGLTYGGALVSMFNPFYGFLVYVFFATLKPDIMWHWSVPAGNYSRIVALALFVGWLVNGMGNWDFGRARWIVYCFTGFVFWGLLSGMIAPEGSRSIMWLESMAKIFGPFVIGLTLIDSKAKLKQLLWAMVLSEGYLAYELNMAYFTSGFNPQTSRFVTLDSNSIAITLVTCIWPAFFLTLQSKHLGAKAIAGLCTIFMLHGIFITFSRGGMLSLIVSGMVGFILLPKQPKHYVIFGLAFLLALRLAGDEVRDRFITVFADETERDQSADSRLKLWANCIDAMAANPIFGIGPNHFQSPTISARYGWSAGKAAHSTWFQLGAELGLIGVGFLMSFYTLAITKLWPFARGKRPDSDPWFAEAGRMVVVGLIGYCLSASFVTLEGVELPYYLALVGAGVLKLDSAYQASRANGRVLIPARRLALPLGGAMPKTM